MTCELRRGESCRSYGGFGKLFQMTRPATDGANMNATHNMIQLTNQLLTIVTCITTGKGIDTVLTPICL